MLGTTKYMAPEILKREAYGKPVDIWAIGVLSHILLTGVVPLRAYQTQDIMRDSIKAGRTCVKDSLPPKAKSLIKKCLSYDPSERPTA